MEVEPELVKEFVSESSESLDNLDRELLQLEQKSDDPALLNSIFRTIHTIKGTSGFFEFSKLEKLAHAGENLLDSLRSGKFPCNQDIASALLSMVDGIRKILHNLNIGGVEGPDDFGELRARLKALNEEQTTKTDSPASEEDELEKMLAQNREAMWKAEGAKKDEGAMQETPKPTPSEPIAFFDPAAEAKSVAAPAPSTPPTGAVSQSPAPSEAPKASVAETSLRVDVGLLDQLMNLVGELVLSRNQILQFSRAQKDAGFLNASQRLNLITSELQEGVMKTRMQPVSNVWSKFPRVVRDLSKQLEKQVKLEMVGEDTELDKTIIEAIKDPLTHIVRNSIDHGIERPSVRTEKGKNPEGTIVLRAFHEGGQVIMEISDDGAGLNLERIKQKAIERGLYSADHLRGMSDLEVSRIIFMPGFSTAEVVTNVSGRGVGMDVVRSNIERIGGQVDISTTTGHGSTIRIKIPLTLAIIPALTVSCSGERFAIPQVVLVELVNVDGEQLKLVEKIGDKKFYRLRGNLLPLVSLADELKLSSSKVSVDSEQKPFSFVVLKADDQTFGLVVDAVHDTEEIVVKPLGKQLKGISVFAGATVMGDGSVALILDVLGLAKGAQVLGNGVSRAAVAEAEARAKADVEDAKPKNSLLILQVAEGYRAALPLELVHRLEEFSASSIEFGGGRPVVQYRSGILPLIDLSDFFSGKKAVGTDEIRVVVYSNDGKLVGFVVNKIEDIIDEHVVLHDQQKRRGTLGSAIIQKRVTDLLDPSQILGGGIQ